MAKFLVFVLVPQTSDPMRIREIADELMRPHRMPEDYSHGWYDYLCGVEPLFDDPITEGRLPRKLKWSLHRTICDVERLPLEPIPYALVTPDGAWHACEANIHDYRKDDGSLDVPEYRAASSLLHRNWPERYSALLAAHPFHYVVAYRAHS